MIVQKSARATKCVRVLLHNVFCCFELRGELGIVLGFFAQLCPEALAVLLVFALSVHEFGPCRRENPIKRVAWMGDSSYCQSSRTLFMPSFITASNPVLFFTKISLNARSWRRSTACSRTNSSRARNIATSARSERVWLRSLRRL